MLEVLRRIVQQFVGDDLVMVNEDTILRADLGLNSFDLVELVYKVEQELNIRIPPQSINKLITVQDVIDVISANNYR